MQDPQSPTARMTASTPFAQAMNLFPVFCLSLDNIGSAGIKEAGLAVGIHRLQTLLHLCHYRPGSALEVGEQTDFLARQRIQPR